MRNSIKSKKSGDIIKKVKIANLYNEVDEQQVDSTDFIKLN